MTNQEVEIQTQSSKGIWGPGQIGVICFIFSFLAAGIMNGISYGRVGDEDKKVKTILGSILVFVVVLVAGALTPPSYSTVFTAFHVGTIIYFYNDQKRLYERYRTNGGEKKAGIGMPILLSIVGLIVLFLLLSIVLTLFGV